MLTPKANELYVAYVQKAIADNQIPDTFDNWLRISNEEARRAKPFTVKRWSERCKCWLTFSVSASTEADAFSIADEMLHRFEVKHSVEAGYSGQILTPEQQRQKAIDKATKLMESAKKKHERLIKKAEKLFSQLAAQ